MKDKKPGQEPEERRTKRVEESHLLYFFFMVCGSGHC